MKIKDIKVGYTYIDSEFEDPEKGLFTVITKPKLIENRWEFTAQNRSGTFTKFSIDGEDFNPEKHREIVENIFKTTHIDKTKNIGKQ